MDRTAVIHVPIGKASFEEDKLRENLSASWMRWCEPSRPAKGQYIRSVTLAPTMGPGVPLELSPTLALASGAA